VSLFFVLLCTVLPPLWRGFFPLPVSFPSRRGLQIFNVDSSFLSRETICPLFIRFQNFFFLIFSLIPPLLVSSRPSHSFLSPLLWERHPLTHFHLLNFCAFPQVAAPSLSEIHFFRPFPFLQETVLISPTYPSKKLTPPNVVPTSLSPLSFHPSFLLFLRLPV